MYNHIRTDWQLLNSVEHYPTKSAIYGNYLSFFKSIFSLLKTKLGKQPVTTTESVLLLLLELGQETCNLQSSSNSRSMDLFDNAGCLPNFVFKIRKHTLKNLK